MVCAVVLWMMAVYLWLKIKSKEIAFGYMKQHLFYNQENESSMVVGYKPVLVRLL